MSHLTMKKTLASVKMNQFKYWFVSNAFHDTVTLLISNFLPCADVQRQVEELTSLYVNDGVEEPPAWIEDLNTVTKEMKAIAKQVSDLMFYGSVCIKVMTTSQQ